MVTDATDKQVKFATSLGIVDADLKTKAELKVLIDQALQKRNGTAPKANTSSTQTQISKHDIVIQRVEKPHSYEFGKAGNRHKLYYNGVAELTEHLKMLKAAGLIDDDEEEARL